jgi:hypothetical protein
MLVEGLGDQSDVFERSSVQVGNNKLEQFAGKILQLGGGSAYLHTSRP